MEIILIAAMAANRVIGRNGSIPWHIPGELKRFREITWGYPVIMGRKTHESIGRPLPGRCNIVVTRNSGFQADGCKIAHSIKEAYMHCRDADRVFNIGGEQLYRLGIHHAHILLLTVLADSYDGNAFFPEFSEDDFELSTSEPVSGPIPYTIRTYRRNQAFFDNPPLQMI